jgi:aspartate/methionine/tyrosine aminotransferase
VFSSRLNWDLRPNSLTNLLEEKRARGALIVDLTESNPTRAGFIYPQEEILAALADPAALRYDPSPRGLLSARESIATYFGSSPDQILLTASTSDAYSYLFKLLCDPGDEILTPRPSYPLFEFLAALESVRVRQYSLRYDGAWRIDFASLEAALTDRTRAIVVVNPNNPTGSFLAPDESDRLQSLAASRDLAILIDEVFSGYALTSRHPHAPAHALTFSMSGLSKTAGLPQLKLGWIVADGRNHAEALDRLELIADTYLSVSTPVQLALPRLLSIAEGIRSQILDRAQSNLATLRSLTSGAACHALNVEGGWYAILQVPRTRSEESWALTLLEHHDVLIQPGFFFDFESEAFLVASLITPPEIFAEGIRRIISLTG